MNQIQCARQVDWDYRVCGRRVCVWLVMQNDRVAAICLTTSQVTLRARYSVTQSHRCAAGDAFADHTVCHTPPPLPRPPVDETNYSIKCNLLLLWLNSIFDLPVMVGKRFRIDWCGSVIGLGLCNCDYGRLSKHTRPPPSPSDRQMGQIGVKIY